MDLERLEKLSTEGDEEASQLLQSLRHRKGEGLGEVTVTYDGKWPSACMGKLTIKIGERTLYEEEYCCSSSGSTWFSKDYSEAHTEEGELTWRDADKYPEWIQEKVRDVLEGVRVCCGGCI